MKKVLFIIVATMLIVNLTACNGVDMIAKLVNMKLVDLKPQDKKYIFLFSDIENIDLSGYKKKEVEKGKVYLFAKGVNKLVGFCGSYSAFLIDRDNNEVKLHSEAFIYPSADIAGALSTGPIEISFEYNEKEIKKVDVKEYEADEVDLAIADDKMFLQVRSGRVVFRLEIVGISVSEEQIKKNAIKKLNYLKENQTQILKLKLR